MDWLIKAALTAATVLFVLSAAQRCGPRVAGLIAALPIITAPTLAWLVDEQGLGFAINAALGSVAACGMLAMFSLAYATACRRTGVGLAMVCGVAAAAAMALPAFESSFRLGHAIVLALGCSALAYCLMRGIEAPPAAPTRSTPPLGAFALVAGGLTALAATLGPALGGFATGLLSSLPLISGAVVVAEHASGGPAAATRFLHGYVHGLFGRAAFGAVFVLLAKPMGTPAALAMGCACAGLVSLGRMPRTTVAASAIQR